MDQEDIFKNPLLEMSEDDAEEYHKETERLGRRYFNSDMTDNELLNCIMVRTDNYEQYVFYNNAGRLKHLETEIGACLPQITIGGV